MVVSYSSCILICCRAFLPEVCTWYVCVCVCLRSNIAQTETTHPQWTTRLNTTFCPNVFPTIFLPHYRASQHTNTHHLTLFLYAPQTDTVDVHFRSMIRMLLLLSTDGALRSLTCVTFLSLAPLWMSANRAFLPPPPPPDWSLGGSDGHCYTDKKKRALLTNVLPYTVCVLSYGSTSDANY